MDCFLKLIYSDWFTFKGKKYPFANGTSKDFIKWAEEQKITAVNECSRPVDFESHYFYGENSFPNYIFRNSNFLFHSQRSENIKFLNLDQVEGNNCFFPIEIECNSIGHVLSSTFIENLNPKILDFLQTGKATILLVNMVDPSLEPSIIYQMEEFFNNLKIYNIVLLQGNIRYDITTKIKMIDSLLSLYQAANEMNRYPYNTSLGYLSDYVREEDLVNEVRPKKFLSFNRFMDRPHRTGLAYLALKYNILDHGYFTFLVNRKNDYKDMLIKLNLDHQFADDIEKLIPYQIDTEHLSSDELSSFFTVTNNRKDLYLNSYIHIVTETQFDQIASPFMSEKTWRPILNLQPFIYLGNHLALNTLNKLGFKTFSPFINESYDEEEDPVLRFMLIEKEIEKLSNYSNQELHDWYISILPVLKYNQKKLYSYKNYNPLCQFQNIS